MYPRGGTPVPSISLLHPPALTEQFALRLRSDDGFRFEYCMLGKIDELRTYLEWGSGKTGEHTVRTTQGYH
jgi:hypothetical protein